METSQIKRFATLARTKIKEGVTHKLQELGFDAEGNSAESPRLVQGATFFQNEQFEESFYYQWRALEQAIQQHGVKAVYEEAAYTWFNRFMAIRILQKNDLIQPVLTFDNPDIRIPRIVSEALDGRGLENLSTDERLRLRGIINDPHKTFEKFSILIVAYCHHTPILQKCFGNLNDYTELLLPRDILDKDGFLDMLNQSSFITDEDYKTTELLGWLYQFYISERKDEAFAKFKSGGKADVDDIAPATQIFTPNWIVKYMVENTIGRIYLDNNPGDSLKDKMRYLVEPSEPTPDDAIFRYDELEQLTMADLACGSGHILLEGFDLLFDMYLKAFYSRREAIESIFHNNLTGIDLDTRAKQLATFALLLKACQKDSSFINAEVMPRVYDMPEAYLPVNSAYLSEDLETILGTVPTKSQLDEIREALELMQQANNLGSIMKFNLSESTISLLQEIENKDNAKAMLLPSESYAITRQKLCFHSLKVMLSLSRRYAALVMNPPYMGSGNMNKQLSDYVKLHYEEAKADLCTTFMDVCVDRLASNGKYGMINMHSWMFLSSFEKLRKNILENYHIDNLLHLGPRTFDELSGEVVQNAAFVISKSAPARGVFYRLVEGKNCADKERMFMTNEYAYQNIIQADFTKLQGSPISYWISNAILNVIEKYPSLSEIAEPRSGLQTSDNNRFLRLWHEVSLSKIGFKLDREAALTSKYKWFGHNKGGSDRRWYGNYEFVINFENDGEELKYWLEHNPNDPTTKSWSRNLRNYPLYFHEGLTWGAVSSNSLTVRYSTKGFTFDTSGPMIFMDKQLPYLLGLMNSKTFYAIAKMFSQGLSIGSGHIGKVPYIYKESDIENIVDINIRYSRLDWDAHETSWDFQENELVRLRKQVGDYTVTINEEVAAKDAFPLETYVGHYQKYWEEKFHTLHKNEEELNRQFIEIYGLQDELTPDVPQREITILQQGEIDILPAPGDTSGRWGAIHWNNDVIIKQLISYAVGCMMGRYRLDKPGLAIAHPNPTAEETADYEVNGQQFTIDDDGIVPLMTQDSPFSDNATQRFKDFLKCAFSADDALLTENLNYVEAQLSIGKKKGQTLEQYFMSDFWTDHKKMYQNRPIYWLFSSNTKSPGKAAFRCLVYMHRMTAFTAQQVRDNYLLKQIDYLKQRIADYTARQGELDAAERKLMSQFQKELAECQEYDVRLHEVANKQITFDLDDGVVVNYAKFGDVLAKIK